MSDKYPSQLATKGMAIWPLYQRGGFDFIKLISFAGLFRVVVKSFDHLPEVYRAKFFVLDSKSKALSPHACVVGDPSPLDYRNLPCRYHARILQDSNYYSMVEH